MLPIFTTYNMTKSKVDQTDKEYQEAEKKINWVHWKEKKEALWQCNKGNETEIKKDRWGLGERRNAWTPKY